MSIKSATIWDEAASEALREFEEGAPNETETLNPGNALVVCFLLQVEARLDKSEERGEQHSRQLLRAASYLQQEQLRCHDAMSLSRVKFFGETTIARVQKHLWSRKPPAPLTAEEQAAEDAWKLAVKQENKAKRVAKATAKAQSGGAGAGPSTSAAGSAGHGQARAAQDGAKAKGKRKAGAAAAAGVGDDEGGGMAGEEAGQGEEDGQQPSKKGKRAPKEYAPAVGSANYAFLVVLYISVKQGIEYETKTTLMEKAEASGLSNKSLFGVGAATNNTGQGAAAGKWFDGWSSMNKSLVNRTPPLVQAWSNPKKIRLTQEGVVLAARLYKDAVARCKVDALPGVDPDQDIASGGAAAGAGAGAGAGAAESSGAGGGGSARAGASAGAGAKGKGAKSAAGTAAAAADFGGCVSVAGGTDAGGTESRAGGLSPLSSLNRLGGIRAPERAGLSPSMAAGAAALARWGLSPLAGEGGGDQGGGQGMRARMEARAHVEDEDGAIVISDSDEEDEVGKVGAAALAAVPSTRGLAGSGSLGGGARANGNGAGAARALGSAGLSVAGAVPTAGRPAAAAAATAAALPLRPPAAISAGAGGGARGGLSGSGAVSQLPTRAVIGGSGAGSRQGAGSQRQQASGAGTVGSVGAAGAEVGTSGSGSHTRLEGGYKWSMQRLQDCVGTSIQPRLPPLPPGVAFEREYEVVLVMDHREQLRREQGKSRTESLLKLVQRIRDKGITVLVDQALPIGDVVWVARSRTNPELMYVLDYILERKSITDLAMSIRDQRYGRQKYWMQLCGLSRPYYLIEGDVDMEPNITTIERKAVKTAIGTLQLGGFHLLRSAGPHPTLLLLASLTRAVERLYRGCTALDSGAAPLRTLQAWSNDVKQMQTRISVRDVFGLMLCAVPGLGDTLVDAILAKYQTWHELWEAYKHVLTGATAADGHRAAEALLAGLPVRQGGLANGSASTRSVGPEASRKVYNTLFRAAPCTGGGQG